MLRLAPLLCLLLAACSGKAPAIDYPALVPAQTLLGEEALSPSPAPALEARADALRTRADALRNATP